MQAAANVARALCAAGRNAGLCFTAPECNSVGLAMMGAAGGIESALKAVQDGGADAVIVLENDLYRRADAATVDALLRAARHVIVLDHLAHATAAQAEMVLPAATFAESEGTLVNNEGRAQRFFKVFEPGPRAVRESWRWLRDIGRASGFAEFTPWRNLDDVTGGAGARAARASARSRRSRRRPASARSARRFRASRTATAGARRCTPTRTCTSRSRRTIRIRRWRSPWKASPASRRRR